MFFFLYRPDEHEYFSIPEADIVGLNHSMKQMPRGRQISVFEQQISESGTKRLLSFNSTIDHLFNDLKFRFMTK